MSKPRTITLTQKEYDELRKENIKLREGLMVLATLVQKRHRHDKKAEQIRRVVSSQLRETIKEHGPIADDHGDIGSATKRISGQFYGLISSWAKGLLESVGYDTLAPETPMPKWKPPKGPRFTNMPPASSCRHGYFR